MLPQDQATQKADAPQPAAQSTPKRQSLHDSFEEGWGKFEEEARVAKETPTREPGKESDCPGCKQEAEAKARAAEQGQPETRTPFKVLKHDGKEVPVYSEEELLNLAQQGFDYTKKRQRDSEERKRWEGDLSEKANKLEVLSTNFLKMYDELQKTGKLPAEEKQEQQTVEKAVQETKEDFPPMDKAKLYAEYGIDDPDFAEPAVKKLVEENYALRNTLGTIGKKMENIGQFQKAVELSFAVNEMKHRLVEAQTKYPVQDVLDEQGQSVTFKQFAQLMSAKASTPEGAKRSIFDLAEEAVKEIHEMQARTQESLPLNRQMTKEEFKSRYPDLYAEITGTAKEQGVAEQAEAESQLPPTPESRRADVKARAERQPPPRGKRLSDTLDEAFKNFDVSSLRGD